jgi:hypothetical protein
MTGADSLLGTLTELARALDASGFCYAIIGAFARNAWARPRATTDADLALAVPEARVEELRDLLGRVGLRVRKERRDAGAPVPELLLLERVDNRHIRIDILVASTPFEESVLARRIQVAVATEPLWVASPEDLLVYKLVAGRPRDCLDVDEILESRRILGEAIDWSYVESRCDEFGLRDRAAALRARGV